MSDETSKTSKDDVKASSTTKKASTRKKPVTRKSAIKKTVAKKKTPVKKSPVKTSLAKNSTTKRTSSVNKSSVKKKTPIKKSSTKKTIKSKATTKKNSTATKPQNSLKKEVSHKKLDSTDNKVAIASDNTDSKNIKAVTMQPEKTESVDTNKVAKDKSTSMNLMESYLSSKKSHTKNTKPKFIDKDESIKLDSANTSHNIKESQQAIRNLKDSPWSAEVAKQQNNRIKSNQVKTSKDQTSEAITMKLEAEKFQPDINDHSSNNKIAENSASNENIVSIFANLNQKEEIEITGNKKTGANVFNAAYSEDEIALEEPATDINIQETKSELNGKSDVILVNDESIINTASEIPDSVTNVSNAEILDKTIEDDKLKQNLDDDLTVNKVIPKEAQNKVQNNNDPVLEAQIAFLNSSSWLSSNDSEINRPDTSDSEIIRKAYSAETNVDLKKVESSKAEPGTVKEGLINTEDEAVSETEIVNSIEEDETLISSTIQELNSISEELSINETMVNETMVNETMVNETFVNEERVQNSEQSFEIKDNQLENELTQAILSEGNSELDIFLDQQINTESIIDNLTPESDVSNNEQIVANQETHQFTEYENVANSSAVEEKEVDQSTLDFQAALNAVNLKKPEKVKPKIDVDSIRSDLNKVQSTASSTSSNSINTNSNSAPDNQSENWYKMASAYMSETKDKIVTKLKDSDENEAEVKDIPIEYKEIEVEGLIGGIGHALGNGIKNIGMIGIYTKIGFTEGAIDSKKAVSKLISKVRD